MVGLATGRAIAISLTLSRVQKLTTNIILTETAEIQR